MFSEPVKPSQGYWDWGNKLVRMSQESLAAPAPLEVFKHIPEKLRPKLKEEHVVGETLFVFIRPQIKSKQGNDVVPRGYWPAEVEGIQDTYFLKCSYLGYTKDDLKELGFKSDFVIHAGDLMTKYELDEKGVWEYAFPKKYGPEEDDKAGDPENKERVKEEGACDSVVSEDSDGEAEGESETEPEEEAGTTEDESETEPEDSLKNEVDSGTICSEIQTADSDSEEEEVNVAAQYPWRTKNADILERAQRALNTRIRQSPIKPEISNDALLEFVKYKRGQPLEVRDATHVNLYQKAFVVGLLGWRIQVSMDCGELERTQVFVDPDWSEVHPEGWCEASGAPRGRKKLKPKRNKKSGHQIAPSTSANNLITVGEVFEVVHPINLQEIVVGQVTEVLKGSYFLYKVVSEIDRGDITAYASGKNEFHTHISSPNVMPCNFCKEADVPLYLTPPVDWMNPKAFSWEEYFQITGKKPLKFPPAALESMEDQENLWKTGMLVEATDVLHSDIVAPAIITRRLLNRLIRVHFLGWSIEFDHWRPVESPCVYPVGWCKLMGYPLSEPKGQFPVPYAPDLPASFYKQFSEKKDLAVTVASV